MSRRGSVPYLAGLLCVAVAVLSPALPVAAPVCVPVHVGLDPAAWDVFAGTFLGEAVGQTFLAQDTLISRLTVWRPANLPNVLGAHLFITAVDTTLTPPRPITAQVLLDGPTLYIYDSDPPGQMVQMVFVMDPPLALPRPGLYAFFLQTADCNQGEINFLASSKNPYPYGIYWQTGRVSDPCYLRGVAGGGDLIDLIFDIEFCRPDLTTPTRKSSWGQLKVIYR